MWEIVLRSRELTGCMDAHNVAGGFCSVCTQAPMSRCNAVLVPIFRFYIRCALFRSSTPAWTREAMIGGLPVDR